MQFILRFCTGICNLFDLVLEQVLSYRKAGFGSEPAVACNTAKRPARTEKRESTLDKISRTIRLLMVYGIMTLEIPVHPLVRLERTIRQVAKHCIKSSCLQHFRK